VGKVNSILLAYGWAFQGEWEKKSHLRQVARFRERNTGDRNPNKEWGEAAKKGHYPERPKKKTNAENPFCI